MDLKKFYIYDIETYQELFTFSMVRADGLHKHTWACGNYHNDIAKIIAAIDYLADNECYLVGFNNIGFDYPIVHEILTKLRKGNSQPSGKNIAAKVFEIAQKQIDSFKFGGFGNTVKTEDQLVKQLDLYKIHHFDNKAKATSLKMIEFNLRMDNLKDLPYDIREKLTRKMVDEIISYNEHDVEATRLFFHKSLEQVAFRLSLTEKYNKDFNNHNDGKIGKDYFKMKLEDSGVKLYSYQDGKLKMNQTKRDYIDIGKCLFDYYDFTEPAFEAVRVWFSKQKIRETKGVFSDIPEHDLADVAKYAELTKKREKLKTGINTAEHKDLLRKYPMGFIEVEELKATEYAFDEKGNHVLEYPVDEDGCPDLSKKPKKKRVPKKSYYFCYNIATTLNVVVNGFRFDFGVGGIHGSVSNKDLKEKDKWIIVDYDVASYYPNLAISNRIYPEHLGEGFCDIYKDVYDQRKSFPKGSAENAMMKLALNSVYGDSNNQYSVFYDPAYTMSITVGGQLSLCLLVDMWMRSGLRFRMIMANTDGVTIFVRKEDEELMEKVAKDWQVKLKLELERNDYSRMIIRDVNSYISVYKEK